MATAPCPAGYFCNGGDKTECTEAGYSCPESSPAAVLCPKGSYCDDVTSGPQSLPAGTFAVGPTGNFVEEGGVATAPCPAGYFCNGGDRTACSGAGYSCPEGSPAEVRCPAGFFCPNATVKISCPVGSYCSEGSEKSLPCAPDSFCAGGEQVDCPSAEGLACIEGEIISAFGTYFENDALVDCPPGSFCESGSKRPCPLGAYVDVPSAVECYPCASGQVATSVGSTNCTSCPAGTYEVNNTACVPCEEDSYCAGGARFDCPDGDGIACVEGQILSAFGAFVVNGSSLSPCPPGSFCRDGERAPCLPGTYASSPSATACDRCARGYVAPNIQSTSCAACIPGTYEVNNIECVPCPAGTRSPEDATISCASCEPGLFTFAAGETECFDCPLRGVDCDAGLPRLLPNFWRFNDSLPILTSTQFYACGECNVDSEKFSFSCPVGFDKTVPECGGCKQGFWRNGVECTACGNGETEGNSVLLGAAPVLAAAAAGLVFTFKKRIQPYQTTISNQTKLHKVFFERVVVLFQILLQIRQVYRVEESGGYDSNKISSPEILLFACNPAVDA